MVNQRIQLVRVIVDAFGKPALFNGEPIVLRFKEEQEARNIADYLSKQEAIARQERERVALAACKPGTFSCTASINSFSVALVRLPIDDEAQS